MSRNVILLVLIALVAAPAAAQKNYGDGTAGTGGLVPTLDAPQAWMGNANFEWRIDNALGGALAYLLVSAAPGSSFFNGTEILVGTNPGALLAIEAVPLSGPGGLPSFGAGAFAAPINFPVIPALAGFSIYAQALVLDFPTPGTLAATPGLESTFTLPPEIFLGTSHGGSSPYYVIDPVANTLTSGSSGGTSYAEYVNAGRDLYTGGTSLNHANADAGIGGATSFTTIYSPPALGIGGLEYDPALDLVYTFTSPGGANARELVAIDVHPTSGTYGMPIVQTSLSLALGVERWAMSPDRKYAVAGRFGDFVVVDTDPNSSTFLQLLATVTAPDVAFGLPTRVEITADNTALIAWYEYATGTRLSRYDLDTLSWIDHNPMVPGIQHIGPNSMPPANMGGACDALALSCDSTFAVLSGADDWLARIDLFDKTGSGWAFTDFTDPAFDMRGAAVAISPDGETGAVAVGGNVSAGRPPVVHVFDAETGAVLQTHFPPHGGNMNVGGLTFR